MIAFGHSWEAIQGYSLGQLKIFLKACSQLEREKQATTIRNLRLAAWGDSKQIQRVLDSLYS